MKLISMRVPAAGVGGATVMAYRAYKISPDSTLVQVEMAGWVICGAMILVVMLIWELVRAYFRLNERYPDPAPRGG